MALICCCGPSIPPVTGDCRTWVYPKPIAFNYLITNVRKAFTTDVLPDISGTVIVGNCSNNCAGNAIIPVVVTGYEDGKAMISIGWGELVTGGTQVRLYANVASSDDIPGGLANNNPCVTPGYDPNDSPVSWLFTATNKPANFVGPYTANATGGDTTYPFDFRSSQLTLTPVY